MMKGGGGTQMETSLVMEINHIKEKKENHDKNEPKNVEK